MKQMKRITLRLSLEKSEDKAISDFLEHIDKMMIIGYNINKGRR